MAEKSLVGTLFNLAVFAAVAYLGYTFGWPLLRDRISGATGPGGACVRAADRTYRHFASEENHYRERRRDPVLWTELRQKTQGEMREAKTACACDLESCTKGRGAMNTLSELVQIFDNTVQAGGQVPGTGDIEDRIELLLADAKRLAREGR